MVVGENKRTANIMEGIESTGDVRLHDHRLRLKQRFDIVRKLGQGTYGKVQLGINKKTGQEVAIKTIKKCKIESDADLVRIRREVQIMSSVRHPNIVHIYEVFENSEKMILVMEYCSGGELYDYLSQQKVLQEDEARRLFRQIATAVYYCHIHKICHRDLKLENVLLDETGSAKIADFGLSNVFKETALLATFCGSPLYASPEIVKGTPYIGPEVDCWSLGVLLYTLVYGAMPFDGSNFKRLVRQISNGDYFEPKTPSSASSLIRDMLTVDPLQRADITYICDHPWVNVGCEMSCLAMSEALATETPVRLDLLLSLAPPAPAHTLLLPGDLPPSSEAGGGAGPGESGADLTLTSSSMAVEPSNSAEQRILDLVAEGGADAIKPSPTRTLVSSGAGAVEAGKRKLEQAASSSATALHRKRERVASCARLADTPPSQPPVPEEPPPDSPEPPPAATAAAASAAPTAPTPLTPSATTTVKPSLQSSATVTTVPQEATADDPKEKATGARPRVAASKKKTSPTKSVEEQPPSDRPEGKEGAEKVGGVTAAADKLTGLSLEPTAASAPTPAPAPNHTPTKPKKLSIAGMNVGNFKEQFERRSSVTPPDVKKNLSSKAVAATSKIAKPKAQSEERETQPKTETSSVRLQQIGIEPSASLPQSEARSAGGVKKTESEPGKGSPADPAALSLHDARRSLQNSMALLSESRPGEDSRRRAARDIISTAIRTGKPPMPYGRSSSAGVTSLSAAPAPLPTAPPTAPVQAAPAPRTFRTEALHRVDDHRNRGTSVERIIPIQVASGDSPPSTPHTPMSPVKPPTAIVSKTNHVPLRRLASDNSTRSSELGSSSSVGTGTGGGEPIKKSAREFIIPIAVEGKGYVTPRQGSLEPETAAAAAAASPATAARRLAKPRRISLVSGGESEDEDDMHMHRLRSSRAARAESVSSGEEEDEEGFHMLTAENLFSTLLHRVRALTNRLNGEEGTGFSQHPHSLFNNLQSPFFNSPHLSRRHRTIREGWGSSAGVGGAGGARDLAADFDSMFSKRSAFPRGSNSKKSSKQQTNAESNTDNENGGLDLSDLDLSSIQLSEKELETLSGLTPALSRRLQRQLLAHLPPAAARSLRRTLSLHAAASAAPAAPTTHRYSRSLSARNALPPDRTAGCAATRPPPPSPPPADPGTTPPPLPDGEFAQMAPASVPQYCTLPRLKRRSREATPPATDPSIDGVAPKPVVASKELEPSRGSSVRSTPDRSLLSKYLTPERTTSLDESYSSDSGSLLSDPSYIAAYGSPALAGLPTVGSLRRHSARLHGEQTPRNRISRFLRPDFFDTPRDESIYARTKKDKEIETQKILREIREKRYKSAEMVGVNSSPADGEISPLSKDETSRTCLSPLSMLTARERSRSSTPFLPILHNIKETALDSMSKSTLEGDLKNNIGLTTDLENELSFSTNENKITRPKSFPIKNITDDAAEMEGNINNHNENSIKLENPTAKSVQRESKLIRPKSYPASSPSPEKVYITRSTKKDEPSDKKTEQSDIEVSFNVNLPKKGKPTASQKVETMVEGSVSIPIGVNMENTANNVELNENEFKAAENNVDSIKSSNAVKSAHLNPLNVKKTEISQQNISKSKISENVSEDKKPTIKKKIIKKVTTKSKSVENGSISADPSDNKVPAEKKKVARKIKEKVSSTESSVNKVPMKKKSVLQSIGQKLEKLTSSKSNSPEKDKIQNNIQEDQKTVNVMRNQREHSLPVQAEPTTESSLIKRAVTLTNVSGLDTESGPSTKTTVSKVLGLFKKFEQKEKPTKILQAPIALPESEESLPVEEFDIKNINSLGSSRFEKPKRPTSLLLNGLERKNKYCGAASDSIVAQPHLNPVSDDISKITNIEILKNDGHCELANKENNIDMKTAKNNLKLDFSRLPRIKQSVCQNRSSDPEKCVDLNSKDYNNDNKTNGYTTNDVKNSNKEGESNSTEKQTIKEKKLAVDKEKILEADKVFPRIFSSGESPTLNPHRNHESTTPEREDIVDRIRRKSFYTRFNEKKHKRKSSLVGPGAPEYNPTARLHSLSGEPKFDLSPTSPAKFDLSPTHPNSYDLSPTSNSDRFRSLNYDTLSHGSHRHNPRLDNYGGIDRTDAYRSLDRKYTGARSYIDPEGSLCYTSPRYARTISLFDNEEDTDKSTSQDRDQHKYSRTLSMYSPGNYATYRPKRIRNPAILLKDSEKEISPENILEKIRERKKASVAAHSKMDIQTEPKTRSNITSKSESDGAERVEKTD